MLPILEGEDFNGEPPHATSVSISRAASPSLDFISPSAEKSSVGLRPSHPPPRASSPALLNDASSSAPASSLPSANCSRPTTAAGWSPPKSPAWQHHGTALRNSTGPLLLSAVVHSGTTTFAPLQPPSTSSWRTAAPGHIQESASGLSSNPPTGLVRAAAVGVPELTTTATGELLAAAAARLHHEGSHELLEFPHSQQSQPHQQIRRGPEQALLGPVRGPPPQPTSPGQQHPGDEIVPWDTPGHDVNTPSTSGYKAGAPPSLNTGALASGLLFPYNDVRRQLGTRRVPSVVLETSNRRLLSTRDYIVSPVSPAAAGRTSPSKFGEGLASPQHPPALALAPLPSPFNSSPHALSCYDMDSSSGTTENGASPGHGSHHQRQLFTPTTVSFARPAPVTLQPMNSRHKGGAGAVGFSSTASAPLSSPTAVSTASGHAGAAQRPRGTFAPWINQRTAHGSPLPVDAEGPDQSLGLWNQGSVPVRVATVVPTLSIERTDGPKSGVTHVVHSQHMRQNGGGGAQGSSHVATLGKSSGVDLTSSLRNPPPLQQSFHPHRPFKPEGASHQDQEQSGQYVVEEAPGFIIRSMSLVLLPTAPRSTQLAQGSGGGASPGSPKGRAATAAHRVNPISSSMELRPSTSPPSPSRSPPRSPPRSPGRQPGVASTACMEQPADPGAASAAAHPAAALEVDIGGTGASTTMAAAMETAAAGQRDSPAAGQQEIQPHNLPDQPEQPPPPQHREPDQEEVACGIVSVAGSIAGSQTPPLDADSGSATGSSGSGEAKQLPGTLISLPLPMPMPMGGTSSAFRRPHVPYCTTGASLLPTVPSHVANNAVLGPAARAAAGAGGGAGAPYGGVVNNREGLAGHSPLRMASKENGGLLLLNVHNQQRLQHQLQQQLQDELQQLQAEAASAAAEAAAEAAISARTFSLRRTVYNDWVEGMPLNEPRRGGGASGGGVVASGVEGKSVVLKRQPMDRPSGLVFKQANRKPQPGSDALHVP